MLLKQTYRCDPSCARLCTLFCVVNRHPTQREYRERSILLCGNCACAPQLFQTDSSAFHFVDLLEHRPKHYEICSPCVGVLYLIR